MKHLRKQTASYTLSTLADYVIYLEHWAGRDTDRWSWQNFLETLKKIGALNKVYTVHISALLPTNLTFPKHRLSYSFHICCKLNPSELYFMTIYSVQEVLWQKQLRGFCPQARRTSSTLFSPDSFLPFKFSTGSILWSVPVMCVISSAEFIESAFPLCISDLLQMRPMRD